MENPKKPVSDYEVRAVDVRAKTERLRALRLAKEASGKAAAPVEKKPLRKRKPRQPAPTQGRVVVGFHFVCDRERGVTLNPDGTFWTGTWVVDQVHARKGAKVNAYVAL